MRVRRLDSNHDWTFGRGRACYAGTSESVAQRVKTRLQSFIVDWFLNLDHGLPWLARMERPADLDQVELDVKRITLETEGVAEILSYEQDLNTRTRVLQIRMRVRDVYGAELPITATRA